MTYSRTTNTIQKDLRRILIIGINCFPELTGIGKYTGEMVHWLADNGYECSVITTYPYYPYWQVQKPYSGKWYKKEHYTGGKLTLYRCPFYVPATPSGLKRVIHEASFFLSAFWVVLRLLFKPAHDEIICVAPPFHLGFLGLFYRFFKGGRLTYHIQDLQIEAARDLQVLKPAWIFTLLFKLEKFILKRADRVSTISEGMKRKVRLKTGGDVMLFPNWSETGTIFPLPQKADLKSIWNFRQNEKIVLYSGSIGEKQGLEVLLDIASDLRSDENIRIVICGSGPYKAKLQKSAIERGLSNVSFLPLQEREVFNQFLNMADVHLVLQKADASDLVMPSKLTNILSAGALALVTANAGTSLYEVIREHRMGVVIPPEDYEALKNGILTCCRNDYSEERRNARLYAERYLDKDRILQGLFSR